jgi:glycosyltransferase involved in cell wall biosynthesis
MQNLPYRTIDQNPLVSIIINNYNYGRFLKYAIDSAINQTYLNIEVIVVDDGSTDESSRIIADYGDKIIAVLKENGGQASAFNAGFKVSRGEVIFFLDSDDILLPTAAAKVVKLFRDPAVVKVHWPLWEINEFGEKSGRLFPSADLLEGDLREVMVEKGPDGYLSPPTTGNAWSRRLLNTIIPVPEDTFKICADVYLFMLAPILGSVRLIKDPQGFYRIHGKNNFKGKILQEETLEFAVKSYDQYCLILKKYLDQKGISADLKSWKMNSWFYRIFDSINEIKSIVSENEAFILVDEDQWEAGGEMAGRKVIPFIERNGEYWGPPSDDATAITEIERHREGGANFIVFAWPAFWWLDYYSKMHDYLKSNYNCLIHNERLIIFNLNSNAIMH